MPKLIIDCHAICHAAKHTIGDLSYEEQKVGIIFGFLRQMLSLSKRFETNQFLFCWDSKKSKRRDLYPSYKIRQPRTDEEIKFEKFAFKQFIEIRTKVLPKFGFQNSFIQTGLEADDIIAAITLNYSNEFIIVSGDNDLFQLLRSNVKMFSPKSKKLITVDSFTEEWGIEPEQWAEVKKIAGCRSDTVQGVEGVAEKRAVQYLKNLANPDTKWYKNIIEWKDVIQRNEALVKLPFEGTGIPKIIETEKFYVSNFIEITEWYGFRSFQSAETMNEWITHFNMT
jgi:DNA polymerase-1